MVRRINQLCVEVARIDANRHLTDAEKDMFVLEKYTVLLRPVGKFYIIYSELKKTCFMFLSFFFGKSLFTR